MAGSKALKRRTLCDWSEVGANYKRASAGQPVVLRMRSSSERGLETPLVARALLRGDRRPADATLKWHVRGRDDDPDRTTGRSAPPVHQQVPQRRRFGDPPRVGRVGPKRTGQKPQESLRGRNAVRKGAMGANSQDRRRAGRPPDGDAPRPRLGSRADAPSTLPPPSDALSPRGDAFPLGRTWSRDAGKNQRAG